MATTARDLLEQASSLLADPQKAHWANSELLGYLNDGVKLLVTRVPEQFSKTQTVALVAGAKQQLPPNGAVLLDVLFDRGAGRVPRPVTKAELDLWAPGWQSALAGPTRAWAYDLRSPKVFWVSPPAVAGAQLDILFAEYPANFLINSVVTIDGAYHSALVDYVVYRALSKDADYAADGGRAQEFYNKFLEKTGGGANSGSA